MKKKIRLRELLRRKNDLFVPELVPLLKMRKRKRNDKSTILLKLILL